MSSSPQKNALRVSSPRQQSAMRVSSPRQQSAVRVICPCRQKHQDRPLRGRNRKSFRSSILPTVAMIAFANYFVIFHFVADHYTSEVGPEWWELILQSPQKRPSESNTSASVTTLEERCAICFFGLPRSFRSMVLPSVVQNLLIPNARHNCDVYVHFYEQRKEAAGRYNSGGKIDPRQILSLEREVYRVQDEHGGESYRKPTVKFIYDTEERFWEARGDTIQKYHDAIKPEDGLPLYFPYLSPTYQNSSIDNIVRQWHSIERVFNTMDTSGRALGVNYTRVGMFRSDVMYVTPVDISLLDDGVVDRTNSHVVVPGFAQYPVNDRMIYGNYKGVKVWATERFSLIEQRAQSRQEPGYTMHSERFLNGTVFPAIEAALGTGINVNLDVCFFRIRADESALVSDCSMQGSPRGWGKNVDTHALVERLLGKKCVFSVKLGYREPYREVLGCNQGYNYKQIYKNERKEGPLKKSTTTKTSAAKSKPKKQPSKGNTTVKTLVKAPKPKKQSSKGNTTIKTLVKAPKPKKQLQLQQGNSTNTKQKPLLKFANPNKTVA